MLTRNELLRLVQKIRDHNYASEQEADADLQELTDKVLDPAAIDYLFHKQYDHLSLEEIVDKIMEYKPIIL